MALQTGDAVRIRGGNAAGVVLHVSGSHAEVVFSDGRRTVSVHDLEAMPDEPVSILAEGRTGSHERWALRLQALYLRHAYRFDELSGLSNARVEPQLHQIYVAHRVTNKTAPRMILADEVGLGKTIEAGIILKELRARRLVDRVLVVCPASLQLQWQHELASKFNEEFIVVDGDAARFFGKGDRNPFEQVANVICSITFAAMPKRSAQIQAVPWDLVVFDEAHRVRRKRIGKKITTTRSYDLADELKDVADAMLLLTATPMQLSPFELWSHIELVEPGLYPSYESYERRRTTLPALNDAMRRVQGWEALSREDQLEFVSSPNARLLPALDGTPLATALNDRSQRDRLMDALVERHPLSHVLVRNRKTQIGGFARRRAHRIPVEPQDDERELYNDVSTYLRETYNAAIESRNNAIGFLMVGYLKMLASSPAAIESSLRKRLNKLRGQLRNAEPVRQRPLSASAVAQLREAPELSETLDDHDGDVLDREKLAWEIDELERLVDRLLDVNDSKAQELVDAVLSILEDQPDEKIIVFTQFLETQRFLADVFEAAGESVEIFNGSMSLDDKEASVRRFRNDSSMLISTESGGEGRNFQFAHILFNYDLPWNPMKVEQRIGRLDRIGQKRDVHIYNLYRQDTIEQRVLEVLEDRIRLFEESVGSLDPILGEVEGDLERIVMQTMEDVDEVFDVYLDRDLDQRLREARELEHTLADFVLDRASLRRDAAAELLESNGPMARSDDLRRYVTAAVEYWGGSVLDRDGGDVCITVPPVLGRKLGLKRDVFVGVFDALQALHLEDRDFFAFGHPLIDALTELPLEDEPVVATAQRRMDCPHGTWVEIIYELVTSGVRTSGRLIRHLVNEHGEIQDSELLELPTVGAREATIAVPAWVRRAADLSRARAQRRLEEERARAAESDEVARRERLDRAERVYEHSRTRLEGRVKDLEERIADVQRSGAEKSRRILPALRGQMSANERRLDTLRQSHETQVDELKVMHSHSTLEVLAAGLVVSG